MHDNDFVRQAQLLGDQNLADYLAHCARHASDGAVADGDDALLFAGGHSYPGSFVNGVIRRGAGAPAGALLDRSAEWFAARRRPYLVWVRDHLDDDLAREAVARGYAVREPAAGLAGVAVTGYPQPIPVPDDYTLTIAADEQGYRDYLDVIAEAWQLAGAPLSVQEAVLFPLASVRTDRMVVFVLYQDARAVAAAGVFLGGGCAGMQWTGIRNDVRGRGLGRIVCAAAWTAALDRGASLVVGQASAVGTPVWQSMGFRIVTRYRRFLSAPPKG